MIDTMAYIQMERKMNEEKDTFIKKYILSDSVVVKSKETLFSIHYIFRYQLYSDIRDDITENKGRNS